MGLGELQLFENEQTQLLSDQEIEHLFKNMDPGKVSISDLNELARKILRNPEESRQEHKGTS